MPESPSPFNDFTTPERMSEHRRVSLAHASNAFCGRPIRVASLWPEFGTASHQSLLSAFLVQRSAPRRRRRVSKVRIIQDPLDGLLLGSRATRADYGTNDTR